MMNKTTKVWIVEYQDDCGESRDIVGVFDSEKLAHDEADRLDDKHEHLDFYVDEHTINESWGDE